MHVMLLLWSLVLVTLFGYAAVALLPRVTDWSQRRTIQLLVLGAPVMSLGVGVGGLRHFAGRICFLVAPPWDYALAIDSAVFVGAAVLAAVGVGVVRFGVLSPLLRRDASPAGTCVETLAAGVAARLGVPAPRVLLRRSPQPQALTWGARPATVVLSTWMLDHLDARELEAVLAHELSHVVRGDYIITAVATTLRDAFFYLPTSWIAWRQLQIEQEYACDDLVVLKTGRPLALASALAKVWHRAVSTTTAWAPSLADPNVSLEQRIVRLLGPTGPARPASPRGVPALATGALAFVGLIAVEAASIIGMLDPMGCGPWSQLRKLL